MNRPPGQGYPYDEPTPIPAEYGVPVPFDRILCGFPIVPTEDPAGPILCANTAPCPIHRDKRVPDAQERERQETEAALNAATSDPLLDLHKHSAAAYGYGGAQIEPGQISPDSEGDGSFDDVAATGSDEAYEAARRNFVTSREPIPVVDPDSPLDLHDQLHADDDHAWHPKTRLAAVLGRRALATRLVDALHRGTGSNLLAAELADRLDTLVTQALTEQQAAITQQLSDEYHQARVRLAEDAARKLKELHDERYRRPSRLD